MALTPSDLLDCADVVIVLVLQRLVGLRECLELKSRKVLCRRVAGCDVCEVSVLDFPLADLPFYG